MTAADTDLRADETALRVLADLLAPADPAGDGTKPTGGTNGTGGGQPQDYAVLPNGARPRYLVPLRSARAAAGVRFRPSSGRADTLARLVLRPILRSGAGRLLPHRLSVADGDDAHPSLLGWLRDRLGRTDLALAIAIGNPRPNRKPVLQVLDTRGRTVCFGKVGLTEHTRRLIRRETAFLADAASTAELEVPELLAHGQWKGHEIALLSDLAPRIGTRLALTPEVVRTIAALTPNERQPVADSPWWARVRSEAEAAAAIGVDLGGVVDGLAPALADRTWTFGAWHGDMAPWNAAWQGDRLLAWDWERTGGPVPIGFDPVHAAFQVAHLVDGLPVRDAAARTAASEGPMLSALGVAVDDHVALVQAYLLELRLRLAGDAHFGPLGRQQRLADALTAALVGGTALGAGSR